MATILLTQGFVASIDDADVPLVSKWKWSVLKARGIAYARRNTNVSGRPVTIFLHRLLLDPPLHMVVDHVDGDGLNNSRANLRVVSRTQNLWNRRNPASGVCWSPHTKKWRATISYDNRKYEVGFFDAKERAIEARAYVASVLRQGIAPSVDKIDLLHLPPTIRRLLWHVV